MIGPQDPTQNHAIPPRHHGPGYKYSAAMADRMVGNLDRSFMVRRSSGGIPEALRSVLFIGIPGLTIDRGCYQSPNHFLSMPREKAKIHVLFEVFEHEPRSQKRLLHAHLQALLTSMPPMEIGQTYNGLTFNLGSTNTLLVRDGGKKHRHRPRYTAARQVWGPPKAAG